MCERNVMAKKKPANAKEKAHMALVISLGCFINNKDCHPKLEIHHKLGQGMGARASHYETMCLCFNHHSAQTQLPFGHAVHKGTKSFEENHFTQDYMIEQTYIKLKQKYGYDPKERYEI